MPNEQKQPEKTPNESGGFHVEGHIKIFDPQTGEVFQDKRNAIHYENMSVAMVNSLSNQGQGWIHQMVFGNGGTTVDPTGLISYLTPNTVGVNTSLYNQTYAKVVDDNSAANTDPQNNKMLPLHTSGNVYSDILVTCLLDYGEPPEQQAFDNSTNFNGEFVFDELGLKTWNGSVNDLRLITHVIFHPVQKSLNRQIQIDYTLRIQTLSNINAV